ncbi:MAG: prolipoprotein diacylglyceryl transferase [Chitinivibrionales bacterium]|nr:prolipoprotein diacylglyceryl transferase [Chitinivibrionales bacterium]
MNWQHLPEAIDPVIFTLGPLQLRWYGLMYLVAMLVVYLLATHRIKKENYPFDTEQLQNFLMWGFLGLLIGAKAGYILFYDFKDFLSDPLTHLLPFEFRDGFRFTGYSGMSYHGGLLGIIIASILYQRKHRQSMLVISDLVIPAIPLGYTFGRLGNFINGELYGRATDVAWGMYFPADPQNKLRHPSQLYEAFGEGVLLFLILWPLRKLLMKIPGLSIGVYIFGYGFVRFFIEFARQPDRHLGFVLGPFSMGQVLCFIMMFAGIGAALFFYWRAHRAIRGEKSKIRTGNC